MGLDLGIGRIISRKPKIKTEDFVEGVHNKIISLKHRIKVHNTNPALKQDLLTEYLNELHQKHDIFRLTRLPTTLSNL